MFYVIFYQNHLEETMTLDAEIENGCITYKVFNRPTKLKLEEITENAYVVKEFHNHAKEYKNTLILQYVKPKNFAQ